VWCCSRRVVVGVACFSCYTYPIRRCSSLFLPSDFSLRLSLPYSHYPIHTKRMESRIHTYPIHRYSCVCVVFVCVTFFCCYRYFSSSLRSDFCPRRSSPYSHCPIHRRFIYEGDTSTHAQGTDPRVALYSHQTQVNGITHSHASHSQGLLCCNLFLLLQVLFLVSTPGLLSTWLVAVFTLPYSVCGVVLVVCCVLTRVAARSPRASLGRRTVCGRTEQLSAAGFEALRN